MKNLFSAVILALFLSLPAFAKELNVLVIDSSINGSKSFTKKLTSDFSKKLKAKHKKAHFIYHDFGASPIKHLGGSEVAAFYSGKSDVKTRNILKLSNKLTNELIDADIVAIGSPMYNFTISSNLKAWIDHIVRNDLTFKYTEKGPVGLLNSGKKVVIFTASGGVYSSGDMKAYEYNQSYLKTIFGFLGVKDVQVISIEGIGMPDVLVKSEKAAFEAIDSFVVNL